MSKLINKILLGSILLYGLGCAKREEPESSKIFTLEDYQKAEWIEVPYSGEIWSSYMGEKISRVGNWATYKKGVAVYEKNDFRYVEKNGKEHIVGVKGKTIYIPDLDKDGSVVSGQQVVTKDTLEAKAFPESTKYLETRIPRQRGLR